MRKLFSVSIIIPTLNRKERLKEALLSLNSLDYPRDRLEAVVVSDGSTDRTEKMIQALKKELNYNFIFLKEKRVGISHAKNVAIKNSSGEIIVSTDDDCLFEKDWLKKLVAPFNDAKVGSSGGPDRAYQKENLFSLGANYAFTCFVGSGGVHGRPVPIQLGRFCPMGCNMAMRRSALNKVGLFDEKIAPGEETDLVYRLEKAGYKITSVKEAFVWHRAIDNLGGFMRMIFKRGRARVVMVQRHGIVSEFIYFVPALMVLAIFLLFSLSFLSPVFLKILLFLLIVYFLVLLFAGFSALSYYRNFYFLLLVPILIALQHFIHGIGFWTSLVTLLHQELLKINKYFR